METHDARQGYERSIALLHELRTESGFLASRTERANYRRVWGRDSVIIGLAALQSDDEELVDGLARSLRTLADHQGPHGEIPSNVDPESERVSYGGTAGRVDADLWFVIGCGQLWRARQDEAFLEAMLPAIERVRFLLGAWEFNARGLIYLPETGDWADEYLHSGYVLYVQLLYLAAQREVAAMHRHRHGSADHELEGTIARLNHLIDVNYWFDDDADEAAIPEDVYHEVLYRKARAAAEHTAGRHWLPFFSPHGYGYRFDTLANVFASLVGVATDEQRRRVDRYIADELSNEADLLPAFHPVVRPVDDDWKDLQMSFSNTFKNHPFEYHNGGLWPMVTGFYVADLAARGKREEAERHLAGIHRANALPQDGEPWSFPEYLHGREFTAGGTMHQGWSAAAAVMGQRALDGFPPLSSAS